MDNQFIALGDKATNFFKKVSNIIFLLILIKNIEDIFGLPRHWFQYIITKETNECTMWSLNLTLPWFSNGFN